MFLNYLRDKIDDKNLDIKRTMLLNINVFRLFLDEFGLEKAVDYIIFYSNNHKLKIRTDNLELFIDELVYNHAKHIQKNLM